ncbi:MAG: hypothetical protein ABJA84_00015 [Polaromonas sp.]
MSVILLSRKPLLTRLNQAVRSLFANGEKGLWLDPSDLSTLYQDSAGTVAVTATGQPLGKESDKSGRANHVSQATAAARPVYTEASGIKYLAFDGVDDGLATATFAAGTLTSNMDVFVAVKRNTASELCTIFSRGGTSFLGAFATAGVSPEGAAYFGAGAPSMWVDGALVPGGNSRLALGGALTIGAWRVVEFRNVNLSAWTDIGLATYPGYRPAMSVVGVVVSVAQSDAKRTQIRQYLANKVGVVL